MRSHRKTTPTLQHDGIRYQSMWAFSHDKTGSVTTATRNRDDYPEAISKFRIAQKAVVSSGAKWPAYILLLERQPQRQPQRQRSQRQQQPRASISYHISAAAAVSPERPGAEENSAWHYWWSVSSSNWWHGWQDWHSS